MAETESHMFLGGKPVTGHVENHEHVSPPSLYIKVLGALLFLTGLTYAVSFADLGPASLPVAMIVAFMKASLVATFFMHLKYDDRFHVFIFVSTMLFVAIFFTFTLFDLKSRTEVNEVQDTFYRRAGGDWSDVQHSKHPPLTEEQKKAMEEAEAKAAAAGGGEGKAPEGKAPEGKADAKAPQ